VPHGTIQILDGRSSEQKRCVVEAVTDAMAEHAETKAECRRVIFCEVPARGWGRAGVLASDLLADS
jgi:4-oxalocrotonate tautomerase